MSRRLKTHIGLLLSLLILPCCSSMGDELAPNMRPVKSAFGVTLGTPGALNLLFYQYLSNNIGVRLSGGYLESDNRNSVGGLQIGVVRRFDDQPPFEQDFSFVVGHFEFNEGGDMTKWDYFSSNYSLLWGSFYLETGLSVGAGDFSSPQLLLQFGYIFAKSRRK